MKMTVRGNEVQIEMTAQEAIDHIGRLAQTVHTANKIRQWSTTEPMPLDVGGSHCLPGVVNFIVTKDK